MSRRVHRLVCRLRRRHRFEIYEVAVGGVLTLVPRCRCGRVDIEGIRQSPWNRKAKRKRAKQLGMR